MNYTITEMKKLSKEVGQDWFNKGAMEFFNTKVEGEAKGNHFITSEYMDDKSQKKYSIRQFDPSTYKVDTVGEFQEYETLQDAKNALNNILG